jgi:hypothetical protein
MPTEPAKPLYAAMSYTDPKTGVLSAGGQAALAQWGRAINSIPVSVSGEQAAGKGTGWTLANMPMGNVSLIGVGSNGPVPLTLGKGNAWNYAIDGNRITTEQGFEELVASYEYAQS